MTNTQNTFEALKFIVTSKEQLKYLLMKLKINGYNQQGNIMYWYDNDELFKGIYAHDNAAVTYFGESDNFTDYDAACKLADADAYITGGEYIVEQGDDANDYAVQQKFIADAIHVYEQATSTLNNDITILKAISENLSRLEGLEK